MDRHSNQPENLKLHFNFSDREVKDILEFIPSTMDYRVEEIELRMNQVSISLF